MNARLETALAEHTAALLDRTERAVLAKPLRARDSQIDPRRAAESVWLAERAAPVQAYLEANGFAIEPGHFPARAYESGRWLWCYSRGAERYSFASDTAYVTELELTEMVVCPRMSRVR